MENKKQLSPEEMSEFYFEFQAVIGITKHMGGLRATEELIELCRIDRGKRVLEVGCGLGRTACYIAKRHGCMVVGVDISERMVDRSKERARREGVEDTVEFKVADVQNLPFGSAAFDAVIGESVTAFAVDKERAVSEYARVTKPGGHVGLNECIWMGAPPSGLVKYMSRIIGVEFLPPSGWVELLRSSGLKDIVARTYKVRALSQFADEIRQFEFGDFLGAWGGFMSLLVRSAACRRFAREALSMPGNIFDVFKYLGHGIYVGKK